MGGRVFLSECRRISKDEYEELTEGVIQDLLAGGWEARLIPSYRNKQDFGDIDLLVSGEGDIIEEVRKMRGYRAHRQNGDCLSFLKKDVQVDIITVPRDEMKMTLSYFSWNDLGNLMGRIARRMGFRYGHRGLFSEVKDRFGNVAEKVRLSRDPESIFSFLGCDFQRWTRGFDEIHDVFGFVSSSDFFAKDCFRLCNLNHGTRMRNKKRAGYATFLIWLEGETLKEFDFNSVADGEWRRRARDFFGNDWLKTEGAILRRLEEEAIRREKFNGKVVGEITGLSGVELGIAIRTFRVKLGDLFPAWVDACNAEEIREVYEAEIKGRAISAKRMGLVAAGNAVKILSGKDLIRPKTTRATSKNKDD